MDFNEFDCVYCMNGGSAVTFVYKMFLTRLHDYQVIIQKIDSGNDTSK